MKAKIILALIILGFTVSNGVAQEFTLTTTNANVIASRASIDMPGLTGNPFAIIVATPLGDAATYNPHPIGAWYYSGKWNLFNSDHANLPPGLKYKIQFFLKPGPNQFLHLVTQQNIGSEGSYIDNPALNNNPNAQIQILQNYAPEIRTPYYLNRFEAKAAYSSAAGRWYITNTNGEPIVRGTVYNIVVGSSGSNTNPNPNNQNPAIPTPENPNPNNQVPPTSNPIAEKPNPTNPFGEPTSKNPISPTPTPVQTPLPSPTPKLLEGFVDMHTHPMSHLGFGKKLLHGAPDVGSIVPAGTWNCNPKDVRAITINQALGSCSSTHGGWGLNNPCGDHMRALVINRMFDKDFVNRLNNNPLEGGNLIGDHQHQGSESTPFNFAYFPHQSSKVHQQMWWEWIKRAHELGKLNVMVALTVNSELLAEILNGDNPKDDKASADLQIDELKSFVGRHNDFMEIAYSPADLRRIVGQKKLAVILGMEVDNIGNFNQPGTTVTQATVITEILRLYGKGVRYIFPIHLVNNQFGGTAVYEDLFNFSNKYSTGSFYKVYQSNEVEFKLSLMSNLGVGFSTDTDLKQAFRALSGIHYPPALNADPTSPNFCPAPILGCWRTYKILNGILNPPSEYQIYNSIPKGHVNDIGLTSIGSFAIKEMMRMGMIIDIDHMSDKSQNDTLNLAEQFDYPVNIGHNGIQNFRASERIASVNNVKRIAKLGGVFGVGTADSEEHHFDAQTFISSFSEVWTAMGGNSYGAVAIGTDVNGMERLPRAPANVSGNFYNNDFPACKTGNRTWNYPSEGVAHYGLIADFMKDVKEKNPTVYENLMNSAEHFVRMWEKAERQKSSVK